MHLFRYTDRFPHALPQYTYWRKPFWHELGTGLDETEGNIAVKHRGRRSWHTSSLQQEDLCEGDLRFRLEAAAAQKASELHWLRVTHTGMSLYQERTAEFLLHCMSIRRP